jgi:hypothetical protein
MNKITEITRRDITELFREGYIESSWLFDDEKIFYPYYGRLNEMEFIKKLYPSHTNNDIVDSKYGRIFDDRFELLKGSDSVFLDFLCAVFHPENRDEKRYWKKYLEKINSLIKTDGYELYESDKISGRIVYSWRTITPEESASGRFIPFSIRHKKEIETKTITLQTIPKKVRRKLLNIFMRYDEPINITTETGFHDSIRTIDALIEDIREHYTKAFCFTKKESKIDNLEQFIVNNYSYCVFDAIELFARYNYNNDFVDEVNRLFQDRGFTYKLLGGKIEIAQICIQTNEPIGEVGLKELINQATSLYRSSNISDKQLAVEKLWDAFERLKTYYVTLDKKKSAEKLIDDISNGNDKYKELFDEEFRKLTSIGNNFRIRHHETDKTDISDNNYYNYFFYRCYALVNLVLKYLK